MNLETYTRGQVARFAIEEAARHGGVNNMLAVAMVLRNRVMAGWGDWLDVAMTAPAKRASFYPPAIVDYRTGNIRSFLSRMDGIWTGTEEDLTGGALFYVDLDFAVARWFENEIIAQPDEHPRVAHVGPVWFFK